MIDQVSLSMIVRLAIAALLGGVLGVEREKHGRPAGLRTHLLVSLGSAAFVILSPIVAGFMDDPHGDPGRIAAQIVSGIGFLGAGAIVKEGVNIRGLTTAACLWIAAAIGMAAGASKILEAGTITILALFTLLILPRFEPLLKKHTYRVLEISMPLNGDVGRLQTLLKDHKVHVLRTDVEYDYEHDALRVSFVVRLNRREISDQDPVDIVNAIEALQISPRRIAWQTR